MKNGFFLVLLSFSLSGWAQMPEEKIFWDTSAPLKWENFEGVPNPDNSFHANANSGISYSWSFKSSGKEVNFAYEVQSFFLPKGSWVKPGKTSAELLAHEQLHFDITELYARKLRKKLKEFDPEKVKDIKQYLRDLYQTLETERKVMQEKYDLETGHSQQESRQQEWQKKVQAEMAALKEFSS